MFNGAEAAGIAVEMEMRGVELYTRAARFVSDAALKKLLGAMAGEEKDHAARFMRIVARYGGTCDSDELLNAVAADVAFPGGLFRAAAGGNLDSERRLLEYAAESERSSIEFYTGLAEKADDEETVRTLNEIIRQEQGHLRQLTERLDKENTDD